MIFFYYFIDSNFRRYFVFEGLGELNIFFGSIDENRIHLHRIGCCPTSHKNEWRDELYAVRSSDELVSRDLHLPQRMCYKNEKLFEIYVNINSRQNTHNLDICIRAHCTILSFPQHNTEFQFYV